MFIHKATPIELSLRARGYLGLIAFRHLATGVLCFVFPYIFQSKSFEVIRNWAPLRFWGTVMILLGLLSTVAIVVARERCARITIILSLGVTSFWAGAFITDAILYTGPDHPGLASPVWAAAWVALSGKDLILCAMPLRSPFEDLVSLADLSRVPRRILF